MRRAVLAALTSAAIVASLFVPVISARAQTTYEVTVGAFLPGANADSMRFFPSDITVHKGDVLHFTSEGFHTATLLPSDQSAQDWIDANVKAAGGQYSTFIPDPDEDGNKNSLLVFNPSSFECGTADNPCVHDGSGVTNSGAPLAGPMDFYVEIDANPGDTVWTICLIHLHMRMKISVVAPNEVTTSQAEIDAAMEATVEADNEAAVALDTKLNDSRTKHETADGKTVWDAYGGYDTHYLSLYSFYPRKLKIKKGDRVRWHTDSLVYEDHSVTFPNSVGQDVALMFPTPQCDPDGDEGTQPDNPPEQEEPPFCDDPSQLELDVPHEFGPTGNGKFTGGDDYENLLFGANVNVNWSPTAPPPGTQPFDLKFTKKSGDKPFKYMCLIHPFMVAKVKVK